MPRTYLHITGTQPSMVGKLSQFQWKYELLYKFITFFGWHLWEGVKRSLALEGRVMVL